MHNPKVQHMNAVIRILRYLKSSLGKGVPLRKNNHHKIKGYINANWTGSIDDRRSTSGYFTFIGGNLVIWRSKQYVVAQFSTKAKYRGLVLGIYEVLWISFLLRDLGYTNLQPIKLFCDSQVTRSIVHNLV